MLVSDIARITDVVIASLLLSLRIIPVLVLAPPFTLMRVPKRVLALLGIGLAAILVTGNPEFVPGAYGDYSGGRLVTIAFHELMVGLVPLLVLLLLFGALQLAGRTVDMQAGFGLSLLLDPASRAQTPLIGTLFAYLAGVTFFASGGVDGILGFLLRSLDVIPLGQAMTDGAFPILAAYIFTIFCFGIGAAGIVIAILLFVDVLIALLSRTVPQMNALLLGMQLKAVITFVLLPVAFGLAAAIMVNMMEMAFATMVEML